MKKHFNSFVVLLVAVTLLVPFVPSKALSSSSLATATPSDPVKPVELKSSSPTLLGEEITFTVTTNLSRDYFEWDFRDGTNPVQTISQTVKYRYTKPGSYWPKVTLYTKGGTDIYGGSTPYGNNPTAVGNDSINFTISSLITAKSSKPALAGDTVTLTVTTALAFSYLKWDFGDNTALEKKTEKVTKHTYPNAGAYIATVTLFDASDKELAKAETSLDVLRKCINDSYEVDSSFAQARSYSGNLENHTLCPADEDWVSFNATADTEYRIETLNVQPIYANHTYLELYNSNRELIAFDEGTGSSGWGSALLLPTIKQAGNYFVRVRHPDKRKGSEDYTYSLQIKAALRKPNLSLGASAWPSRPQPGEKLRYYLWYGNRSTLGVTDAQNVVITGTLPSNVTYLSSGSSWWWMGYNNLTTYRTGNVVVWKVPSFAVNQWGYIYLEGKVSEDAQAESTLESKFEISASNGELYPPDNTATVRNVVRPLGADPIVWKWGTWRADPGEQLYYGISYYNDSISPASNVQIVDTLPSNTTFSNENWWRYSYGGTYPQAARVEGSKVTWNIDWLGGRGGGYLSFQTKLGENAPRNTSITNKATITADEDINPGNSSSSADTYVRPLTRITGKVTGPGPELKPLPWVYVYAEKNVGGVWNYAAWAYTDDNGKYVMRDIEPGTYRLHFMHWGWPTRYPDEYYNDAADPTSDNLTFVKVVTNQTTADINTEFNDPAAPKAEISVKNGYAYVEADPHTGEVKASVWVAAWMGEPSLTAKKVVKCKDGTTPTKVELQLATSSSAQRFLADATGLATVPPASFQSGKLSFIATCNSGSEEDSVGRIIILRDPSGIISDATTGQPIVGATVNLYKVPNWTAKQNPNDDGATTCQSNLSKKPGDPWDQQAPTFLGVRADPSTGEIDPTANPLITNQIGYYGWNVAEGCWYVEVTAEGYEKKVSPVVGVPPEVTDLNLSLQPYGVRFNTDESEVSENAGKATFAVSLTKTLSSTVTVKYTTTVSGTAKANTDFTPAQGTLTFSPGEAQKTFTVPILDDQVADGNKTVVVALSGPTGAKLSSPNVETLTVLDNENPNVQFSLSNYTTDESKGTAAISVTLSEVQQQPVAVDYASSDGTATAGKDYTAAKGTLYFAPGEKEKTFDLYLTPDELTEGPETVSLSLSNARKIPSGTVDWGTQRSATLTIQDATSLPPIPGYVPPSIQFGSATFTAKESEGTALISVTLSAAQNYAVTVDYATSDASAKAGSDYTAISGTLTFAAGDLVKTFNVPIVRDSLTKESMEMLNLTLSNPTPSANAKLGTLATASLNIIDDLFPSDTQPQPQPTIGDKPSVQLSSSNFSSKEGKGTAIITVTLSAVPTQTVKVDYATGNITDTATAGQDYVPANGTLSFAPGTIIRTVIIPIVDDGVAEEAETVSLALSNPQNATLGQPSKATLLIKDKNDSPAVIVNQNMVYLPFIRR